MHRGWLPAMTTVSPLLQTASRAAFVASPQFTACSPRQRSSGAACAPRMGASSLAAGTWFKVICGASAHDVALVRNLARVYAAAGADCVDVAADAAVVAAARAGIEAAGGRAPLLMVSVCDDEDVHFRKALFDPALCPPDCPRPCERVCPADAIDATGVLEDKCYGCGRCVPACPLGIVEARSYVHSTEHVCEVLSNTAFPVDAVEIHTGPGHLAHFRRLWSSISDVVWQSLSVVAVSFPDLGTDAEMKHALREMWKALSEPDTRRWDPSAPLGKRLHLIWQTDGRAMSGDIGRGTAHAAVAHAKRTLRILSAAGIPGHVQLAGGTNKATVPLLESTGLLRTRSTNASDDTVSGIAVGGHARKVCQPLYSF